MVNSLALEARALQRARGKLHAAGRPHVAGVGAWKKLLYDRVRTWFLILKKTLGRRSEQDKLYRQDYLGQEPEAEQASGSHRAPRASQTHTLGKTAAL